MDQNMAADYGTSTEPNAAADREQIDRDALKAELDQIRQGDIAAAAPPISRTVSGHEFRRGTVTQIIGVDLSAALTGVDVTAISGVVLDRMPAGLEIDVAERMGPGKWLIDPADLGDVDMIVPPALGNRVAGNMVVHKSDPATGVATRITVPFAIRVDEILADAATALIEVDDDAGSFAWRAQRDITDELTAILATIAVEGTVAITVSGLPPGGFMNVGDPGPGGTWTIRMEGETSLGDRRVTVSLPGDELVAPDLTAWIEVANAETGVKAEIVAPLSLARAAPETDIAAEPETAPPPAATGPAPAGVPEGREPAIAETPAAAEVAFDADLPESVSAAPETPAAIADDDATDAAEAAGPAPAPAEEAPGGMAADELTLTDEMAQVDFSAVLRKLDLSMSAEISIIGLPDSARLSAGTHHDDGSWNVSSEEVAGLTGEFPQSVFADGALTASVISVALDEATGLISTLTTPIAIPLVLDDGPDDADAEREAAPDEGATPHPSADDAAAEIAADDPGTDDPGMDELGADDLEADWAAIAGGDQPVDAATPPVLVADDETLDLTDPIPDDGDDALTIPDEDVRAREPARKGFWSRRRR